MKQVDLSFEFFPPKTEKSREHLIQEADILANIDAAFFSITYGAGGSTRDGTLQTLNMLQSYTNIPIAPHISCMGASRAELIDVITTYKALGVKHLVALRGDLPSGMGQSGDLCYANELVGLIRAQTGDHFHIEVAAYPECHPQAKCPQSDIVNLKRKVDAGANSAITQYFYNPDAYFYFMDACAENGITIPVIPGVMPIRSYSGLLRFSGICGAEIPQWMRKRFEAYLDDVESMREFGIEVVHKLCEQLIRGGATGLHFYTMNHADLAVSIIKLLHPAKNLSVVAG